VAERELHNHHFDSTIWNAFAYMKQHATKSVPLGGAFWDGGAQVFINKGTDGRWCDTLTTEDCALYERMARAELGETCARWLATGERIA
jgi:aryl sulfotransferase